MDKMTVALE